MEKQQSSGFIKLHRDILQWEWYQDSNTKDLFLHCLLKANFTDKKWQGILIKRGSFITSYDTLSRELKIGVQSIRTSLNKLKLTGELTSQPTSRNTLLIINNYELYQSTNTPTNTQLTNNQQTTNKQLTTTKKEKKVKNYKEVKSWWNSLNYNLSNIKDITPTRKTNIKARIKQSGSLEDFKREVENGIRNSSFLQGENDRGWKCDFDFVIKSENYTKIIEGKYEDEGSGNYIDPDKPLF